MSMNIYLSTYKEQKWWQVFPCLTPTLHTCAYWWRLIIAQSRLLRHARYAYHILATVAPTHQQNPAFCFIYFVNFDKTSCKTANSQTKCGYLHLHSLIWHCKVFVKMMTQLKTGMFTKSCVCLFVFAVVCSFCWGTLIKAFDKNVSGCSRPT